MREDQNNNQPKSQLESSLLQKIETKKLESKGLISSIFSASPWIYTTIIAEHFGFDIVQLAAPSSEHMLPNVRFLTRDIYIAKRFLTYLHSINIVEELKQVDASTNGIDCQNTNQGLMYIIRLSAPSYINLFTVLQIENA